MKSLTAAFALSISTVVLRGVGSGWMLGDAVMFDEAVEYG